MITKIKVFSDLLILDILVTRMRLLNIKKLIIEIPAARKRERLAALNLGL
jgi:hypothetical protein